ncbi:MAG TPA: hypothetical protein VGL29_20330, partial [Blastocatellia bacterium]
LLAEEHSLKTADFCSFPEQRVDLIANSVWRHPIVVVPMHYQIASACDHTFITFIAQRSESRHASITNLRIRRNKIRDTLGAIVQYDEFLVLIVLRLKASDRERHAGPPIRRRHHARNKRL